MKLIKEFIIKNIIWRVIGPTCTVEQRKFLDEIISKFSLKVDYEDTVLELENTSLDYCGLSQDDFDCDLAKVFLGI